jgi:hypothetical protein
MRGGLRGNCLVSVGECAGAVRRGIRPDVVTIRLEWHSLSRAAKRGHGPFDCCADRSGRPPAHLHPYGRSRETAAPESMGCLLPAFEGEAKEMVALRVDLRIGIPVNIVLCCGLLLAVRAFE